MSNVLSLLVRLMVLLFVFVVIGVYIPMCYVMGRGIKLINQLK